MHRVSRSYSVLHNYECSHGLAEESSNRRCKAVCGRLHSQEVWPLEKTSFFPVRRSQDRHSRWQDKTPPCWNIAISVSIFPSAHIKWWIQAIIARNTGNPASVKIWASECVVATCRKRHKPVIYSPMDFQITMFQMTVIGAWSHAGDITQRSDWMRHGCASAKTRVQTCP